MRRRIIVTAGGDIEQFPFSSLGSFDFCIAADSGLDQAEHLGLQADLVIGDMDSVSSEALRRARERGATVEIHPEDKNASDLELALERAFAESTDEVVLVGGGGGRLDHAALTLSLIAVFASREPRLTAYVGGSTVETATPRRGWQGLGETGDPVSLITQGGDALGVTTQGLRFPLKGEQLNWGSSRGLSNSFTDSSASVELIAGTLLVLRPQKGNL